MGIFGLLPSGSGVRNSGRPVSHLGPPLRVELDGGVELRYAVRTARERRVPPEHPSATASGRHSRGQPVSPVVRRAAGRLGRPPRRRRGGANRRSGEAGTASPSGCTPVPVCSTLTKGAAPPPGHDGRFSGSGLRVGRRGADRRCVPVPKFPLGPQLRGHRAHDDPLEFSTRDPGPQPLKASGFRVCSFEQLAVHCSPSCWVCQPFRCETTGHRGR